MGSVIYLLDTDTLIFVIRGLKASQRQRANRSRALALVNRCRQAQRDGHSVGLSAMTVSELEFGARNSTSYESESKAIRKILLPFETYDYDSVACPHRYGKIRHEFETQGRAMGSMDMLIAAHALALDATLVTNNRSHFSRVHGLTIENWSSGR